MPGKLSASGRLLYALNVRHPVACLAVLCLLLGMHAPARARTDQEAVTGYICPMHADVVSDKPGNCDRCGMTLVPGNPLGTADYELLMETVPRMVKPGAPARFRFVANDPITGAPVREFAEVHDRLFHLFVISRDLSEFMHVHPDLQKDGSFAINLTVPKAGQYMVFADFFPVGGSAQLIGTPLVTAGYEGDATATVPTLALDTALTKTAHGVTVDMKVAPSALLASTDLDIPFTFTDAATGQPVTDLERYLGAFAHGVMLNEDMQEFIHTHPDDMLEGTARRTGGGPEVVFHSLFPRPGRYRMWLQFQRKGELSTVVFTFRVARLGDTQPE
jgi:hypothetical protein